LAGPNNAFEFGPNKNHFFECSNHFTQFKYWEFSPTVCVRVCAEFSFTSQLTIPTLYCMTENLNQNCILPSQTFFFMVRQRRDPMRSIYLKQRNTLKVEKKGKVT